MPTSARAAAALSLALLVWLCLASRGGQPNLWGFFATMAALTLAQCLAWKSASLKDVLFWALLFRIPAWMGSPLYEDDFYRYLWDGREFALTGNPYGKPPADFQDSQLPAPFDAILPHVNFPEIPTIYGPVCQASFALAYWMQPGSVVPLKAIYAVFDIGIAALLWRLGAGAGGLALYLWAPLVIKEIGFTLHTDILTAFWLVACLWAVRAGKPLAVAGACCGLAVGAKVTALLMIPLFVAEIRDVRGVGKFLAGTAGAIAAVYAPFVVGVGGLGAGKMDTEGLKAFLDAWEFNSFVFAVAKQWMPFDVARNLCMGATAAFVLWIAWRAWHHRRQPDYVLAIGTFFLLSPVVNPWYLVMLLPFVALQPSPWAVAACASVLLSYATGNNLPDSGVEGFQHPWWVRPLELALVVAAALWFRPTSASATETR
jgi:alpha-1,6-mannosyltransferase